MIAQSFPLQIPQVDQGQQGAPEPVPLPHPEIPPPVELPFEMPMWMLIGIIIGILALIALVVWLLFLRQSAAPAARRDPWRTAFRALKDLQARVTALTPQEVGHRVSEILRAYYLDRYSIPAPYRTTPELFESAAVSQSAPVAWRERFEPIAERYDEISFAPKPTTSAEAASLVESALGRLEEERV